MPPAAMLSRRRSLGPALAGLLLVLLGPVVYCLLIDYPYARATGAPMWALMGIGTLVALVAGYRDRSRRVRIVSALTVGLALLSFLTFFWVLDLPTMPEALSLETAPDFTLVDHDGQDVSLSQHCKAGPTLLVFYRGHW